MNSSNFSSTTTTTNNKNNNKCHLKILKKNLNFYKEQTDLNNDLNARTRMVLNSLNVNNSTNKTNNCPQRANLSHLKHQKYPIYDKFKPNLNQKNLIKFVSYRQNYLQHANYWQQIWLFTDNPIYFYEKSEGFENPFYLYLSSKENLRSNFKMVDSNLSCSNIYESILDFKNLNNHKNCDSDMISSPESQDSGIHSDDKLNRLNSEQTITNKGLNNMNSSSGFDSLYSSIISSKKSSDNLSSNSKLNDLCQENDDDLIDDQFINHVEQHELPLGWIRCCDDSGIYYWHKPSGTVTRRPPPNMNITVPKKNFNIDEYESFLNFNTNKSNETDSLTSNEIEQNVNNNNNNKNHINKKTATLSSTSTCSSTTSTKLSNDECLEKDLDNKTQSNDDHINNDNNTNNNKPKYFQRFYVRSLGWVKINENDLTPERSSKAVNKCINDLSRGVRDFNDVVARWGDGKDLYLDLEDNYLILTDPIDDKILNKQSINSIRVWGVGRDNGRDFAYVARDKQTKIHMCHVFRSDSGPAKEIANALRDTCKRIIQEKNLNTFTSNTMNSNSNQRPNYLPDLTNTNSNSNKKIDINLKLKSVSYNNNELKNISDASTSKNTTTTKTAIDRLTTSTSINSFPTAQEEPKKAIKCKYLGSVMVNRPSGMDTLNDAIEKIYMSAFEEYKRKKREKRLRRLKNKLKENDYNDEFINLKLNNDQDDDDDDDYDFDDEDLDDDNNAVTFDNLLDLNSERRIGLDVNVIVSPSTVTVRKLYDKEPSFISLDFKNEQDLILECRIRYLSFMGISNDVRLCGFIMHNVDNTFRCHAFLCENSAGILCKTIEAACKLRYQKCLDAHPEASLMTSSMSQESKNVRLSTYFSSQLRNMFDTFKNRNLFSNLNNNNNNNNK